jgi:hypothetical protein
LKHFSRIREAAAITLLGWYLMIPPLSQKGPDSFGLPPDTSAPYSKWIYNQVRDHFDSEDDCKNELAGRVNLAERGANGDPMMANFGHSLGGGLASMINEQTKLARCVPDTDSGLKPKQGA